MSINKKITTEAKLTSENQGAEAPDCEDKVEERKGEERENGAKVRESKYLETVATLGTLRDPRGPS